MDGRYACIKYVDTCIMTCTVQFNASHHTERTACMCDMRVEVNHKIYIRTEFHKCCSTMIKRHPVYYFRDF